jgi:pimeloyl-ACP methyl ester carboxylesterase
MKPISCVLMILLALCEPAGAQTGITGTWRAEGIGAGSWTLALAADGSRLTGRVSSCTSLPVEIYEGRIDGSTISFKCQSADGDRVVTLTGKITGDEMVVTWRKQVRDGGTELPFPIDLDPGDANAREMFGPSTPPQFTMRHIKNEGIEVTAALNLPEKGVKVEGTLYLPQDISRVRAVIVLLNSGFSWGGMGGTFYTDPELRKLAATLECGLLLPRITNIVQGQGDPSAGVLRNAALGGADGLLMLVDRLAQESGHREVAVAPLLLWGHSRSGHFAATFAALHPRRTVAIVDYHTGAAGLTGHDKDVLSKIPALILMARADVEASANRPGAWPPAEGLWRSGRLIGAPWTFGIEPDAVHQNPNDLKKANGLVIPWIAAVLRQRLSPDGGELVAISDASAYLGNTETGEIAPFAVFPGAKQDATWLPDEQSARGWRILTGATN